MINFEEYNKHYRNKTYGEIKCLIDTYYEIDNFLRQVLHITKKKETIISILKEKYENKNVKYFKIENCVDIDYNLGIYTISFNEEIKLIDDIEYTDCDLNVFRHTIGEYRKILEDIKLADKKDIKDLDIINYSDIPYNEFNNWLTECISYNTKYVFDTDLEYYKEDELEEKQIIDIRDLDIKFTNENDYDDEFEIAVYCKYKDSNEWEYLDNITTKLFDERLKGVKVK